MVRPKGMLAFDYEQLDPGIRRLVRWLHERGFRTTDSGDGVSKKDMSCAMAIPNVAISANKSRVAAVADELLSELQSIDVIVRPMDMDASGPCIQASYDPTTGTGVVLLLNVDDSMLPAWVGVPPTAPAPVVR